MFSFTSFFVFVDYKYRTFGTTMEQFESGVSLDVRRTLHYGGGTEETGGLDTPSSSRARMAIPLGHDWIQTLDEQTGRYELRVLSFLSTTTTADTTFVHVRVPSLAPAVVLFF